MIDYTVVGAALAGAVAGLLLLRLTRSRDGGTDHGQTPPPAEPATLIEHAPRPVPTAAPILLAVGVALAGVGLAVGSGGGALDVRPLLPAAVVLLAALVTMLRPGGRARSQQAPGSDDGVTDTAGSADARAKKDPWAGRR